MVAPVRLTNGQRLFDQLESYFDAPKGPSDFEILRLQREAEKLVRVDGGEGYIILAGVQALQWNCDEAVRLAQNAVRLDSSTETLMNAALTMRNIHRMDLANEFMARELSKNQPSPITMQRAVAYLLSSGEVEKAVALMTKGIELGFKFDDCPDAIQMSGHLEQVGISTDQVRLEFAAVSKTLLAHRKRIRGFGESLEADPDGGLTVVATFEVQGSQDDELSLSHDLADLLGALDNWNPVQFGIELVCVEPYADQAKRAA